MSEQKNEGHSAYSVWLVYIFRGIEKILPALKGKSKYGWAAPLALCILVLAASVGFGIYVNGYVIHPPKQFTGLCTPPAEIVNHGTSCVLVQTAVVTVSGTVTTTHVTIPSGVILYNQTRGG